jgi:capsular exopolysaccharide synthesis family protein
MAEAYGVLQTNIAFARPDAPVKTLVFTSPLAGDGKTTTAVNLSISLAQRGVRVLLVDADLRRGLVHSALGGGREPGLSEVLRGHTPFDAARRSVTVGERGRLDFLPTGKLITDNVGQTGSPAMREFLLQAREEYDIVIVDTPPVNIITDAALLGSSADGVVLVARSGVTDAAALTYAVEQLRHVRAPLLGVVLNDIDLRRDAAYDSSYRYFRDYEYSTSDT